MKGWIAVLLMLLSLPLLAQEPPRHNDFAYGIPLEVDGDGALYSLELPDPVYRYSTRRDLGDMRIYNGYGEIVSHLLRAGIRHNKPVPQPIALHFFPLSEAAGGEQGNTRINIATDRDGAVVDFWEQTPANGGQVVTRYLIDASQVSQTVEKLQLAWDDTAESFLVPVSVEYSNDLSHWQPLVSQATLASLRYQDLRLGRNEIELPAVEAKYYRISWPLGEKGILLKGVEAVVQRQGDTVSRRWMTLPLAGDASHRGEYNFSTHGYYPVDRVRIKLPQANSVVRVKLFSRKEPEDSPWQLRYQGLVYNLRRDGHTLLSDDIRLQGVTDPLWRLQVDTGDGSVGQGEPQLELGWVPHRVYFFARGETPFTLAFGAAGIGPSGRTPGALLATIERSREGNGFIKAATPGPYFELGGPRRLEAAPPSMPWKRWLLWSVLLFGVIMITLMARNHYRLMRDADRID